MTGRPLRPPRQDTALDRAWRCRQWRLERAHDDWGLHAGSGDPRAPIHRAAGLVQHCRQSVRDKIQTYRKSAHAPDAVADGATTARDDISCTLRAYRLAIAGLAQAIADFEVRNAGILTRALPECQEHAREFATETAH